MTNAGQSKIQKNINGPSATVNERWWGRPGRGRAPVQGTSTGRQYQYNQYQYQGASATLGPGVSWRRSVAK